MKKKIKSLLTMLCSLVMAGSCGLFAACQPAAENPGTENPGQNTPENPDDGGDDQEKTITSIHLVSSKTEYMRNDVLDTSALTVTAQYSDGDFGSIAVSEGKITLSAGDNDTLTLTESGQVTVTFTYGSFSDSVEINVSANALAKFEAEEAQLVAGSKGMPTVIEEVAGHMCAGNLSQNIGAAVVYNIWAESAGTAVLTASIGTAYNKEFTYHFRTEVNGSVYNTDAVVKGSGWTTFVDVELGEVQLTKGLNTISFNIYDNGDLGRSGNLDYITLESSVALDWATDEQISYGRLSVADITLTGVNDTAEIVPVFSGENTYPVEYTFEGNNIKIENGVVTSLVEETETVVTAKTEHHEVTFVVKVEGEYGDLVIGDVTIAEGGTVELKPQFTNQDYASEITYTFSEDGIVSIADGVLTALKTGIVTVTAKTEHHETTFTVKVYDPTYYETYRFEAENGTLVEGTKIPETESSGTGTAVGNLNGNVGGGVTFTVYAGEACEATLSVNIGTPYPGDFSQLFDVFINEEPYATSAVCEKGNWAVFQDVVIGTVSLKKGANTISLIVNAQNGNRAGNLDYIELSTYETLAASEDALAMGRLVMADIVIPEGNGTATLAPVFTNPDYASETVTYTFEGENIKIENGVVTGLVENTVTTVTAATEHFSTTFTVTVQAKYGTLEIEDITLSGNLGEGSSKTIAPVFSKDEYPIEYTFEGNNIKIENGVVTGLVEGTTTVVTAKTEHHEVTFTVTVGYTYGTLDIDDVTVKMGQTATINAVFSDETYASEISYKLSEEGIITIADGVITPIKVGTVTVTATTEHHEVTFTVTVESESYTLRLEAEDAAMSEGLKTESAGTGTTVGGLNGASAVGKYVEFTVYAEKDGTANLVISVGTPYGNQVITNLFTITVNGTEITTQSTASGSTWTKFVTVDLGEVQLKAGENKIRITLNELDSSHGGNIDYIELESTVPLAKEQAAGAQ